VPGVLLQEGNVALLHFFLNPERRGAVAARPCDLVCAEGVDCHRRGKDRRAREESGELSQLLSPAPRLVTTIAKENQTYCSKLVRSSQGDADADRECGPAQQMETR
jgi:hypothetical protein